ncbi:MAG TPA: protein kinase [Vicinamibacterales bacterium]|nr:protein kinase [Vicinamibacterales bacterium]
MPESEARLREALAERYAIHRELGRGGMATVYLAEDLKHRRPVAVKVLNAELAAALGPERFLREIEISARLHHPHILPLYDSGEVDGFLYYVMPHVDGESLRDRLTREKQLPIDDAIQIAREVADALSYAHSRGVVHRDIKPDNILLESGHAVVVDFGIARAISEAGGDNLTSTGMAIGTPAYMSPEQASGSSELDGRSDLYSLGCVLYEMLASQPPFTGPTVEGLIRQHLTTQPPNITSMRPSVAPSVAAALHRALAKTPADRFNPVAQFGEALVARPVPEARANVSPAPWFTARWAVAVAILLITLASVLIISVYRGRSGPAVTPGRVPDLASVAVLPFDNISDDPGDLYLSDGMTEEVIGQLAQVQGLKVISRTSVAALKGSGLTLPQIADTLNVRYIVEGSVRRAGNRVRVTAQLIDAETDAHLWANSYERPITDLFAVQEEIARQVTGALAVRVVITRPPVAASRTDVPDAYDAYLRGRYALHSRTSDGLREAMASFERAITLDPNFAPAYATQAMAYGLWVTYGYGGDPDPYAAYGRAIALAERAIALDPSVPEGYMARGYVGTKAHTPSIRVSADFASALHLAPNSADVHGWYAHFLARERDYDRSLQEAQRAIDLDPLAPGRRVGYALDAVAARRYDDARGAAHRATILQSGLGLAHALEAWATLLLGAPERCVSAGTGPYVAARASCLHAVGRTAEGRALIDSVRHTIPTVGSETRDYNAAVFMSEVALYWAWVGEADSVAVWMGRAFEHSPSAIDFRLIDSGIFDGVRENPVLKAAQLRIRDATERRFRDQIAIAERQLGRR